MGSTLHPFPRPKANQCIFSQGENKGGSVSMSTDNIESLSPFTESHLSSYYCSQFISVQNIDHLLAN